MSICNYKFCIPIFMGILMVSFASADIVGVSSIAATGTAVEFFTDESHLIDGSGLSGAVQTEADFATVTHGNAGQETGWVTDAPNGGTGDYFQDGGAQGSVEFEFTLDATYNVKSIASWAYHFGSPQRNAYSQATFDFSVDGGLTISNTQTDVAIPEREILEGAVGAVVVDLVATDANFIRMTVTDNNFDGVNPGGDRVGLSEIRFSTVAAVPEPSAFAFLGAGMVGVMGRRRRKN